MADFCLQIYACTPLRPACRAFGEQLCDEISAVVERQWEALIRQADLSSMLTSRMETRRGSRRGRQIEDEVKSMVVAKVARHVGASPGTVTAMY